MPDSQADSAKLYENLTTSYRKLSTLERQMIQVFAIAYEPVNRSLFFDCLLQMGLKDKGNQHFTAVSLKGYVDRFLQLNLLTQERSQSPQCNPSLVNIAVRDAVQSGRFEQIVSVIEAKIPVPSYRAGSRSFTSESQFIREVRIGIYRQDIKFVEKQFDDFYRYGYSQQKITLEAILYQVCNNPFDAEWFQTLNVEFYEIALVTILTNGMLKLKPTDEALALLQKSFQEGSPTPNQENQENRCTDPLLMVLMEQSILRGDLEVAISAYDRLSNGYKDAGGSLLAWLHFIKGDRELAIAQFRQSLKVIKKVTGKRQVFFSGESGLFFILALIQEGSVESMREAEGYSAIMAKQTNHWLQVTYSRLQKVLKFQLGDIPQKNLLSGEYIHDHTQNHCLEAFALSLLDKP